MKKQMKYFTEEEITKDIDSSLQKYKSLIQKAIELELVGEPMVKSDDATIRIIGRDKLDEARRKRKSADNITTLKIPRLSHTLAAFRTRIIPGIIDDGSVVLEKR